MTADTAIELGFDGRVFARYRPGGRPRPHLDRLFTTGQVPLLRDGLTPIPDDSQDHPHHRGVWWGHRAVRRDSEISDVWTEFAGHGAIAGHGSITLTESPDLVEIAHEADWLDGSGRVLFSERRVVRAHPPVPDGTQALDLAGVLIASAGAVTLGDTKEAGLVAVRVAPGIEERRGGRIETSNGAVGEAEAWGRPAAWCAYAGTVLGVKVGLAVFDHPDNPRHPVPWHVRDYGLLAANPFGCSDFPGFDGLDGALPLAEGEQIAFEYRLLTFTGQIDPRLLDRHYESYAGR